jgi:hypothetical protein
MYQRVDVMCVCVCVRTVWYRMLAVLCHLSWAMHLYGADVIVHRYAALLIV